MSTQLTYDKIIGNLVEVNLTMFGNIGSIIIVSNDMQYQFWGSADMILKTITDDNIEKNNKIFVFYRGTSVYAFGRLRL